MNAPQIVWLPDGRRLHMNHGPIDLIVEAWGERGEIHAAYRQAAARFQTVLTELVAELAELRTPVRPDHPPRLTGKIARNMYRAVAPHGEEFITPMAAVAGAVADEMLAALVAGRTLSKAYVNNGGDIALHLGEGEEFALAIAGTGGGERLAVRHGGPVRGVATSGWRGRSFSLGIADAVTVLAADGATADAAATMIANAVDLPCHDAVTRVAACLLQPDTDLGDTPVTQNVGALSPDEIDRALAAGVRIAQDLMRRNLIEGAALFLGREARAVGRAMPPLQQIYSRSAPSASAHNAGTEVVHA
ncbi:MAG: UPF0280 family protein [Mesorhizobium sp.]